MKKHHLKILKVFDELKFNLGKKTLIEFLKGNRNPAIDRNNLDELESYGCLFDLEIEKIEKLIDLMIDRNLLYIDNIRGGFKVISRTILGTKEIYEKKYNFDKEIEKSNKIINNKIFNYIEEKITEKDKELFKKFDFFLNKFNDKQKKAILCESKNILVIAGAGSGKTTVLTKRIEFLTKFKSIDEKDILAITFTKKAKEEMIKRLEKLKIYNVNIETFNSFSEKFLKKYEKEIYSKKTKVIEFKEKINIVKEGIKKLNINFELLADNYFNKKQLREKNKDELFFIFLNDVFSILDYFKNIENEIDKFYEKENSLIKKKYSKEIYELCIFIEKQMKKKGLRDFSDQIIDIKNFFENNKKFIPKFQHILIDEFQDINRPQFELIKLLNTENIFAVGDPRQAIYGWRGSDIKYISQFQQEFENTNVISLEYNYRSGEKIINVFNEVIKPFGLVNLKTGTKDFKGEVFLKEFSNEQIEQIFVLEAIKKSKNKRNDIFVLARTNRILENYAKLFSQNGINYIIKSEEDYQNKREPCENEIVLATVHSIKGMEAKEVYVVSSNSLNFPNKTKDNFVMELVKSENQYNKYQEELRLFYVALSRAKEKLIITYTGNLTPFITKEALEIIGDIETQKDKSLFNYTNKETNNNINSNNPTILKNLLKNWRADKAKALGDIPTYMIISNKAIDELVMLKPSSKGELFNINGLGEVKIAKYGDEILKIING
jgi:superfamily I DNA/RNA helicase